MKMFVVVYSRAADYDVLRQIKKTGIQGYTKITEASGEGVDTEPKLGTHTWPGANNVLYIAVQDEEVPLVSGAIRQLKVSHPRAGVKGFVLPLEEVV